MNNRVEKRLIIYKASAGAGKTYKLSQRYVNLLDKFALFLQTQKGKAIIPKVCGENRDKSFLNKNIVSGLDSIVAITFTNKAAAEMKERVLRFLKEIAAGFSPGNGFDIKEKEALEVLVYIIENFSDFQITTIDSFMNNIFKAFAVDLNVYPDYDITFEEKEIFDIALNELFTKPELSDRLLDFLNVLLHVDKGGFDGERMIKKALTEFKDSDFLNSVLQDKESLQDYIALDPDEDTFGLLWGLFQKDYKEKFGLSEIGDYVAGFSEALEFINRKMNSIFDNLKQEIISRKEFFNSRKILWLNKSKIEETFNASIWKNMQTCGGDYIGLILSQKKKDELGLDLSLQINKLLSLLHFLYKSYYLFKAVYNDSSAVEVYKTVLEQEEEIKKALNLVVGGKITDRVKSILDDFSLPYAFCRIGERISHYLIDEFQDTSDSQFSAMFPLIQNALSEGGSLFVVGDKKQAIYGWRGGDYRVFDKVEVEKKDTDGSVSEEAQILGSLIREEEYENEPINENFRSAVKIVEFNNNIFKQTVNENCFKPVLAKIIEKNSAEKAFEEVKKVFENYKQKAVSSEEGYVEVSLFKCIAKDKRDTCIEQKYKPEFFSVLDDVLERYPERDVMILARKKKDLEKVVEFIFDYNRQKNKNVSFVTEDSLKLLNNKDIKNLLLLAMFFSNPNDASLFKALGENDFFPLKDKGAFFNLLKKIDYFSIKVSREILVKTVKDNLDIDFGEILEKSFKDSRLLSPYEFFVKLISDFNFPDYSFGFDLNGNSAYFDRFLEVALNFAEKGFSVSEIVDYFYENDDITLSMPESVDAIRLMTIHKAKGLEAEVVIIPFYDWDMLGKSDVEYIDLELSEWFDGAGSRKVILKNDGKLRNISLTAEKKHFESKLRRFIESLNLMYVANTRPKKELYIIGGLMLKDDKKTVSGRFLTSAYVLKELGKDYLEEGEDSLFISIGEKRRKEFKALPAEEKSEGIDFSDSIRQEFKTVDEKEFEFDYRKEEFGTLFHLTMSFLKNLSEESKVKEYVNRACLKALKLSGFENGFEEIKSLAEKTVFDLKEYFFNVEREWCEKEVVGRNGFVFRIDRLVFKNNQFVVIDYKTGKKDPEKHFNQVKSYLDVFRFKGFKLKGIIYYTEDGEVVDVEV